MASTTTPTKAQSTKARKEKKEKGQQPAPNDRLKTVVRRLPPNLPEDIFWQSVLPWVTESTITWKTYYPGKQKKRFNKENIPSRAYIAFKNEEHLAVFSREYDGHVFRDKSGIESQAVVEFAPFQKIPTDKKKPDARTATIEQDDDYVSFVKSLQATSANAEPVSVESLVAATQPQPQPKTTPLLEAIKAEKAARLEKEIAQRNQAPPPKKEEPKKRAPPKPQPVEPGKKAPKKAQKQAPPPKLGATPGPSKSPSSSKPPPSQPSAGSKSPKVTTQHPQTISKAAASSSAPADGSPPGPSKPAERRARPVVGLASRQFEAALTGAVGAAPAKTSKETVSGATPVAGPGGEKGKRRREEGKAKASRAEGAAAPNVPSILQRPARAPAPAPPPAPGPALAPDSSINKAPASVARTSAEGTAASASQGGGSADARGGSPRGGGGARRHRTGRGRGAGSRGGAGRGTGTVGS